MFQLQFNSGPAIESMLSSDEDEQSSNQLGQEAEDEGLFQFRRSNASQYHKVLYFMTKTQISYISMNFVFNINYCCLLLLLQPLLHKFGNWPWASKQENGLADSKYRFTLTSIRHPRFVHSKYTLFCDFILFWS